MIPDKYILAKAGFLYTGQGDKTTCFQCGVSIYDWERTDDAWKEHKKWSPNCDYLNMVGLPKGVDVPDTLRGFGPTGNGIGLPKSQTMDTVERPSEQTTQPPNSLFRSTPKTDSNLFVYRY